MVMATGTGEFGGMEKHTVELASALSERGLDICLASDPAYHSHLPDKVGREAIPAAASRRSPRLLWRLLRLIAHRDYDIVHAQGTKAAQLIAAIAPFARRPHYVATLHGFKSRYPGPGPFKTVIAVSHALARDIGYVNTRVIYNGILPAPTPALGDRLPAIGNPPLWLAVGRLVPAKGFDILVRAFKNVPGTLWIAGEGPQRPQLTRLIEETGQQERIRLLGHSDQVATLMARCDRLVISSRREGFSYVFAEAMLAGIPLVATDVPVANEFLPPELIAPTEAPEALAMTMNRLDDNLHLLEIPRARAREQLTLDAMADQSLALYRELMS
ncbi:Glycosyltransferase involved in cell wall bisynthesis [Marinobacter daqiaonensis]|uniref:Glycosyltransferase involved in cell wall bisynthesis n=2 Tax=Marinobacter daqiaonensis TaxID=650891 RepID=A0A1I6K3M4_9GAMM|nr:Glycosyltransferase involved in cell wall bisynthesis [Marinobacter daqiaonensis]